MFRFIVTASLLFLSIPAIGSDEISEASDPSFRTPRQSSISLELGANSLASLVGVTYGYYFQPQMALDVGLGLSGVGIRPGLRARYNFSRKKLSPFVSGAFKYGLGTGNTEVSVEDIDTKEKLFLKISPSAFLDVGLGVDYLANNGFLFLGTVGYSMLMGGDNFTVVSGSPSPRSQDALKLAYGSGVTLGLSFGKAF